MGKVNLFELCCQINSNKYFMFYLTNDKRAIAFECNHPSYKGVMLIESKYTCYNVYFDLKISSLDNIQISYLNDLYNQPEKHLISVLKNDNLLGSILKNMCIATTKKRMFL